MKNKAFSTIFLSLILIFSCSYTFPDKLPDWKEINLYIPEKLEFQKTTIDEFKKLSPNAKLEELGNEIVLLRTTPQKTDIFSEINIGFRHGVLDWVEFLMNKNVEMNEFVSVYGFPKYIDIKYSDTLDYYTYEKFNISTDKRHIFARSINLFGVSGAAYEKNIDEEITDSNIKFFDVFPCLEQGVTTEREFLNNYPDLLPYMEGEFDTNSIYTLREELEGAGSLYQQVLIKFENGILSWINLVPNNFQLKKMLHKINEPYKVEKVDKDFDFYVFDNFIFVVDKKQNKINSVGLINIDKRF